MAKTGMTWTGFRPSDDNCQFGYLVPANMFAVVVLGYVEELAPVLWVDLNMARKAKKLGAEIDQGIQQHSIVEHAKYGKIYAYEVDGLGHHLLMDDANVPSLSRFPTWATTMMQRSTPIPGASFCPRTIQRINGHESCHGRG